MSHRSPLILLGALLFSAALPLQALAFSQNGFSVAPSYAGDFTSSNFQTSLTNLAATHANYVTLIVPLYQSNDGSTDVQRGWNTPSDQDLASAIQQVHAKGMKVMLKIHLDTYGGDWRANINPGDRNTWFANYGAFVNEFASLAQANGVEEFCVGAELINMATYTSNGDNTQRWQQIIASVRQRYSGQVTYSANWGSGDFANEKAHIGFWGSLDSIGVSAYFPLSPGQTDVTSMTNAWAQIDNNELHPLSVQYGKPILFTEIGYRSVNNANNDPFDFGRGGYYEPTVQANAYQALANYWSGKSYFQGVQIWEWKTDPNAGGAGNVDYTVQNKPAQATLTSIFAGGVSSGPDASFAVTSSTPSNQTVNTAVPVAVMVKDTGGAASNILVDLEIYDQNGSKVFQQYQGGQNFVGSDTKTLTFNWTPSQIGNYTVKAGIFSGDWSRLYKWEDSVVKFTVTSATNNNGGGSGGTPPPPGDVQVWWPSNGSAVSGLQPFKAVLSNAALSDYQMFWQVDGDRLNPMGDVNDSAPHKESDVDLTGWNWRSDHTYTLNFVAKDKAGNTLGQKSVTITVN